MKLFRMIVPPLAIAAIALAQTPPPPPAAPAPPAPMAAPTAPVSPTPAVAPLAPLPPDPPDFADLGDLDLNLQDLQDNLRDMKFNLNFDAQALKEQVKAGITKYTLDIAANAPKLTLNRLGNNFPFAFAQTPAPSPAIRRVFRGNDESLYNSGQRALDQHRYPEALEYFNQVASHDGPHVDGAAYWKAYTLIKLGRKDEALAAIADLRKSHPQSRWLDDAKALEVEAGKPVSPESESDEELKLIALNGLMQSDPDRALPLLENLLKGNQSPRVKKRVVYVLAASESPKAQQLLQQVAKGQSNPDVQLAAIQYLGSRRNDPAKAQLLMDIYNSNNDANIKRAIINSLSGDRARILQIAKAEKNSELRTYAIHMLGGRDDAGAGDALAAMYPDSDQDVKNAIIDTLASQKNAKAMVTLARGEKDAKQKQRILERMVGMHSPEVNDYLMEILK